MLISVYLQRARSEYSCISGFQCQNLRNFEVSSHSTQHTRNISEITCNCSGIVQAMIVDLRDQSLLSHLVAFSRHFDFFFLNKME